MITIGSGVVRLDMGLLHLAILNDQGVSLAAHATKDGRGVEAQIQGASELACRVTQKSDLWGRVDN